MGVSHNKKCLMKLLLQQVTSYILNLLEIYFATLKKYQSYGNYVIYRKLTAFLKLIRLPHQQQSRKFQTEVPIQFSWVLARRGKQTLELTLPHLHLGDDSMFYVHVPNPNHQTSRFQPQARDQSHHPNKRNWRTFYLKYLFQVYYVKMSYLFIIIFLLIQV
jgi:hypothetical protein